MTRARSTMHQHELDIHGFPEEPVKPLDLADTYSSDEITVKIQPIASLVDLHDVEDDEDTLIMPAPEVKYPGVGLAMALLFGLALWALPLYYIATRLIK